MKKTLPKIVVILGPTATGKSDLAVEIARRFDGEVVSADSRQVYRGLDQGAGKITRREMRGVTHHLLDVADPAGERYTVDDFKRDGAKAIADILERGKLPIICGGTGFYIDALVFDEAFPAVPPDQKLRAKLARLAKRSPKSLMKMLVRLDPRRAAEMDPHNIVRIIRAIEIARALGTVPKIKRRRQYDALFIGLTLPRTELAERIHIRLLKRMRAGMVREVSRLHKKGVSWKRLHAFGLEYRYVGLYLQKKLTKSDALSELEHQIVDFSKRQMRWFKRNRSIRWFSPSRTPQILRAVRTFLIGEETSLPRGRARLAGRFARLARPIERTSRTGRGS